MLESDTPDTAQNPDKPLNESGSDAGEAAPPRRRKAAPRKAAARKAPADPVPADPSPADPSPAGAAAAETASRKAARSRKAAAPKADAAAAEGETAPRRAARSRKAAAPKADAGAATADAAPAPRKRAAKRAAKAVALADGAVDQPAGEADAPAVAPTPEEASAPTKTTRRRRANKTSPAETTEAASPPAAGPASDEAAPGEAAADEELPQGGTAQAVLFRSPTSVETPAPAPARRRRGAPPVPVDEIVEEIADEALTDVLVAEVNEEPDEVREAAAEEATGARRRRRRGRRGRGGRGREHGDEATGESADVDQATSVTAEAEEPDEPAEAEAEAEEAEDEAAEAAPSTRRRRRRRRRGGAEDEHTEDDPPNTVVHVREAREPAEAGDGVRGVKGSTRLEAKRQRRRDGRESGRRRPPILSEAEFLARREAVDRVMAVRQNGDRTQIAVLEDDILVEHYVTRASSTSYVGNVYLGRVQNVLPSMEAAFIDIGKGRNGVLYAGEVNWDAAGLEGKARAIESAMSSGDAMLVQVTKDPIGHKGARLTSQVSLPGRFLVYVPGGGMTGISRKLPDTERHRLKAILKKIVPEDAGVIVRTAAEGASEADLTRDVERLKAQWESIRAKAAQPKTAPKLVYAEPDLAIRVVRDIFNEDFRQLIVAGDEAWQTVSEYVADVAPDLAGRVVRHTAETDLFHELRVDEQITKALDRKVWLPSGGSLVIDRTEAMTVIDVNTGKFVGSGGNLEQTVTRNNLEAAEEIVRQLRLRDVGGIVVIDFIDMVLESNRELVLRRLTECLGRDRTKHQVAEVTSLGLVQMTRKRVGEGLLEAFSDVCPTCGGRGLLVHTEPVDVQTPSSGGERAGRGRRGRKAVEAEVVEPAASDEQRRAAASAMAAIAGAVHTDGDRPSAGEEAVPEAPGELAEPEAPSEPAEPEALAVAPEAPAAAPPTSRRRRRAASRPAGPPVAVGAD